MIQEFARFEVRKVGSTQFGYWAYGTFTSDIFELRGLFTLDKDYQLVEGSVYEVKKVTIKQDKKGQYHFTLAF